MPSSRSGRRAATIAIQTAMGALFLAGWALLSMLLFDEDLIRVVAANLPYFIAFELGIFSRYVPGLRTIAKRFE